LPWLRLGRGGLYARTRDLRFGAEPVFYVAAVFPAALVIDLIRAAADFFFEVWVRFSSYVCGWLLGSIFWDGELLSDVPRARQRRLAWRTIDLNFGDSYKAKATPASEQGQLLKIGAVC